MASAAKRYEAFNLQEISDLLDTTYIARKLRHVCFARSHQAVVKTEYRFGLLDAIYAHVEAEGLLAIPAIALYFHGAQFLSDPAAEDHFFRFRETLSACADQFPDDELRALYLLALNFGIKKSNETGGQHWYRATFDLYREALDRELLLENGILSRFAYHNIVGVAIRLREIAWAEEFLHRYKPALERSFREAAFSLNMVQGFYQQPQRQNPATENLLRNRRNRPPREPPRQRPELHSPAAHRGVPPRQLPEHRSLYPRLAALQTGRSGKPAPANRIRTGAYRKRMVVRAIIGAFYPNRHPLKRVILLVNTCCSCVTASLYCCMYHSKLIFHFRKTSMLPCALP